LSNLSFFLYWLTFGNTLATTLPSSGTGQMSLYPLMSGSSTTLAQYCRTIGGCYTIMMTPVLRGRYFVPGDVEGSGGREGLPVGKFSL
jgi:hypothetical protein